MFLIFIISLLFGSMFLLFMLSADDPLAMLLCFTIAICLLWVTWYFSQFLLTFPW